MNLLVPKSASHCCTVLISTIESLFPLSVPGVMVGSQELKGADTDHHARLAQSASWCGLLTLLQCALIVRVMTSKFTVVNVVTVVLSAMSSSAKCMCCNG
eukprot:6483341-Amphidinium_carterae.1